MSPDLFLEFINAKNSNKADLLKYLIDIQERFDLSFDSDYMNQIEDNLKPNYRLLVLDLEISRAIDTGNTTKISSLLPGLEKYWRYHFALKQLDRFGKPQARLEDEERRIFQQLSDIQKNNYRRYYY
jgi:hypothetical protein